ADFGPPVIVPISRIGNVGIGKSEVLLGLGIVGGLLRQIDFLSVLALDLLIHVRHIQGLRLEGGRRREKHEQVVSLFGGNFGRCARGELCQVDVVDGDIGIVLLAPLFGKDAVKPLVVFGNEVTPLNDLERLLLCLCSFRKEEIGSAKSGRNGSRAGNLNEVPTRNAALLLVRNVLVGLLLCAQFLFFVHVSPP